MRGAEDGSRGMPKKRCPLCGGRIFDSKNRQLRQRITICTADDPDAEYFLICPGCRARIGFYFSKEETLTDTNAEFRVSLQNVPSSRQ